MDKKFNENNFASKKKNSGTRKFQRFLIFHSKKNSEIWYIRLYYHQCIFQNIVINCIYLDPKIEDLKMLFSSLRGKASTFSHNLKRNTFIQSLLKI